MSGSKQPQAASTPSTNGSALAFRAYFDVVTERGLLLGELEQALHTRRIPPAADGTNEFLRWLASLIDDEYGVGPNTAMWHAAITAGLANAHAAIWVPGHFQRKDIEEMALAYALGGLRTALGDEPT